MHKRKEQSFARGHLSKGVGFMFRKTDMMLVAAALSTSPDICLFSLKRRDKERGKKISCFNLKVSTKEASEKDFLEAHYLITTIKSKVWYYLLSML